MSSRSQFPRWSADGKYIAYVSDRSDRDEIWISDPEGKAPKKITDLDNEKGALVWAPDSKSLLYTACDEKDDDSSWLRDRRAAESYCDFLPEMYAFACCRTMSIRFPIARFTSMR